MFRPKHRSRCSSIVAAGLAGLAALAAGPAVPGQAQEPAQEPLQSSLSPGLYAELTTTKGVIVISLEFRRTPMTVANFVGLAEGTIRNQALPLGTPYYDGSPFHRVVPGHVIQAGRPVSDVASTPGYSIPNEIDPELGNDREGMVGMSNGGPHTGKSQFYITLGNRSYLDGDYAVFGEVVRGMDVVRSIVQGDIIETVKILRIGEEAGAFRPTTASFRQMRHEVWARVRAQEAAQLEEDLAYLDACWPQAIATEQGWRYVVLKEGKGSPVAKGDTVQVRYTGRTVRGMAFASTADEGKPHFFLPGDDSGEVFSYIVGTSKVNPGLDDALAAMNRGEKRLVIVPAELGYDPVGFYGSPRKGEPRFVIRPRSILVYEVEILGP